MGPCPLQRLWFSAEIAEDAEVAKKANPVDDGLCAAPT